MDCLEAIRNRRSVRAFTDQPVDPVMVQDLIEVANLAPSARNLQPWAFWTFMDAGYIQTLGQEVKNWIFHVPPDEPFASPMRPVISSPEYQVFYGAPVLILVLSTSTNPDASHACCLAAGNLMLAARSMGLGSAWVGIATEWFELQAIKQRLSIPQTYTAVVPLVIGYPEAWPTPPERRAPEVRWCSLPHLVSEQE